MSSMSSHRKIRPDTSLDRTSTGTSARTSGGAITPMHSAAALLAAALFAACDATLAGVDPDSDAPAPRAATAQPQPVFASYADALAAWRKPEDVSAWIGARFAYDGNRALLLSESERAVGRAPAIYEPSEFYSRPIGICVDLSRFAVETLRLLAPELNPRYLMVEFSPTLRTGKVLRRHWLASYERDGGHYFFADSKVPGQISGPYASVQAFISEYAAVRQRQVLGFRQQDSYRRQPKSQQRRKSGDAQALAQFERQASQETSIAPNDP